MYKFYCDASLIIYHHLRYSLTWISMLIFIPGVTRPMYMVLTSVMVSAWLRPGFNFCYATILMPTCMFCLWLLSAQSVHGLSLCMLPFWYLNIYFSLCCVTLLLYACMITFSNAFFLHLLMHVCVFDYPSALKCMSAPVLKCMHVWSIPSSGCLSWICFNTYVHLVTLSADMHHFQLFGPMYVFGQVLRLVIANLPVSWSTHLYGHV